MNPSEARTTEELVRAIRAGRDVESDYRELHRRYYATIYRFYLSRRLSPEDARDLTQTTFLSVFTCIRDLADEAKFEGWLFGIARNALARERERAGAEKRKGIHVALVPEGEGDAGTVADIAASQPDPQAALLEKERLDALRAALAELPEQRRRAALLHLNAGLKYHQIAELMDISLNTVKAHLHQARSDLRRKLGRYFGEVEF